MGGAEFQVRDHGDVLGLGDCLGAQALALQVRLDGGFAGRLRAGGGGGEENRKRDRDRGGGGLQAMVWRCHGIVLSSLRGSRPFQGSLAAPYPPLRLVLASWMQIVLASWMQIRPAEIKADHIRV